MKLFIKILASVSVIILTALTAQQAKASLSVKEITVSDSSTLIMPCTNPAAPTVTPGGSCGPGTVVLSASPGSGGTGIQWENSVGTVYGTGTSFTTPSLSTTVTYYARSTVTSGGSTCVSTRVAVQAKINAIPGTPTGALTMSLCAAGNVTLDGEPEASANSTRWYTASSGGSPISVNQFVSATTTFWVSSYNTTTGCESVNRLSGTITIIPPGLPSGPSQNTTICGSGSTVIWATPGANTNSLKWYTSASGGSAISTGTSYGTPTLSSTTTYYISSYNTSAGCESGRVPINATVLPIPGDPSVTGGSRCGAGPVVLTGTPGTNATSIAWYTSSDLLTEVDVVFNTPSLSSSTQFKAKSYNQGCLSPNFITVNATINTTTGIPAVTPGSRCGSGTVVLSATPGSGATGIQWENSGGTVLGTGTSFTTPSISATTTYYARSTVTSGGVCLSSRVPVTATVNPIPGTPTGALTTSLCAAGNVTLDGEPEASANSTRWYTDSSGGSPISVNQFITATITFWVSSYNTVTGCESVNRLSGTITITPPGLPSGPAQNNSICGSGSTVIWATPGANTNSLKWYTSSSGGSPISTGTAYSTPALNSTTTYYISSYNTSIGCESGRVPITATVSPVPGDPSPVGAARCGPGMLQLTGTPGTNANLIAWYTAAGVLTETDVVFTTTSLSSSQQYKAKSYNQFTGCYSPTFIPVNAIVNTKPGNPTLSNTTECIGPVTLTGTVGSNGNAINWYAAATGGSPVSANQNLTTNTTFYGASVVTATGCESSRVAKTVSVTPRPASPTIQFENYLCGYPGVVQVMGYSPSGSTTQWYAAESGGSPLDPDDPSGIVFTTPSLTAPVTYYVAARASITGCESTPRVPVVIDLKEVPAPPQIVSAERCGPGTLTLTASAPGYTIHWRNNTDNTVATGPSITADFSQTTTYSVWAFTPYCGSATATATATINVIPPATTDPEFFYSSFVRGHGQVNLVSAFYSKWYDAPTGGNFLGKGFAYKTEDLSGPTLFYHARYDSVTECESSRVAIEANIGPLISNGYVKTETIRTGGVTQESQIDGLTDAAKTTTIEHFDGLLRPVQQIMVRGSVSGKDIVQPIEYDPFGRTTKQYLPYVAEATAGTYRPAYASEQLGFYSTPNDKVADDTHPFAVSVFEASPTGRILEQGGVGTAFQITASTPHTSKAAYSFNTGAISDEVEEVRKFNSDGTSSGFYAANILSRNEGTDPEGHKTITFTDGGGRTIVVKQQLDEVINTVATGYLQTYYIYDDFGRIRYMISPKGVNALRNNGWSLAPILKQYVHQFVYDARGRMVEKKEPGKGREYFVYDKYDRLVLTQDSILRVSHQWIFQKYDLYGRAVVQGLYTNTVQNTRPLMEALVSALYKPSNTTYPASTRYEDRGTALQGYTNVSFPKTNQNGSALSVTQVNYYDTYDFDFNGTDDFSYTPQALPGEAAQGRSERMPTGSKTLVLGTANTYLYAYIFYDRQGRVIQKRSNSYLSSTIDDLATNVYDFEGKVTTFRKYHRNAPDIVYRNEYDASGRIKNIFAPASQSEPVQFAAGTNVTVTGNAVQKTGGTHGAWDAGTISTNYLATNENGWVEFKAGEANTNKMMGLSNNNSATGYASIRYALYPASGGTLYIYESGASKGAVGSYITTDILSVERRNGKIVYKKNFQVIYTSQATDTGPLYVDCTLYSSNGSLNSVNLVHGSEVNIARYEYNELGQLVDKKLHNTSGNDFLQSIDYRYNIRGQLSSINNAPLTIDPSTNDEATDLFGLEMLYHTQDAGLNNTPYYNGNISAIKWKGPGYATGNEDQRSYQYTYDKANRLKAAVSKMNSGSAWNKEANAFNEAMAYDHNGNILTLKRNQRHHQLMGDYAAQQIDSLSYKYDATVGDRIKNVEDLSGMAAGFKNTVNTEATQEYAYDVNGNLYSDVNKGITSILYNYLNLPTAINFSGGKKIEYTYDAAGTKLKMRTLKGDTVLTVTDYVNEFVYEGNAQGTVLKYFGSPEGRTVMNGNQREYQYAIGDHQGNTRVVFTSATPVVKTSATGFETDPGTLKNFPSGGNRNGLPLFNQTAGGTYSQLLNGGNNSRVGVGQSFAVYPGDKVKIQAYAKYEAGGSTAGTGFATALLQAFTLSAPAAGETGTPSAALHAWGGFIDDGIQDEGTAPQAFVNIVVFDKDYNLIDAAWDQVSEAAQQVGVSPDVAHDEMMKEYTIKEPGFVYLYVSNNSPVNVYFDDVSITHTPTNVVQYNEYYPYGLSTSASWTREGNKNDHLYNAGSELNATTGWYDLAYRNYDPALGRFMQVDPMATATHSVSGYSYANNNPIAFNDPNGALPVPWDYLIAQFNALEAGMAAVYGMAHGGSSSIGAHMDWDWTETYRSEPDEMSAAQFLANATTSDKGGYWENGSGHLFESDEEALAYGMAYNEVHDSWKNTEYGGPIESMVAFGMIKENGVVPEGSDVYAALHPEVMNVTACACNGGPGDPKAKNASVVGPIALAAEQFLLAVGLGGMNMSQDYYHANDRRSMKKNYVYEIVAFGFQNPDKEITIKYGISSDKGYRVESQVARYNARNDGMIYTFYVRAHVMGRAQALAVEQFYVTMHLIREGNVPRDQYRPSPWGLNDY